MSLLHPRGQCNRRIGPALPDSPRNVIKTELPYPASAELPFTVANEKRMKRYGYALLALTLATGNTSADNWPMWRGLKNDGISQEKGLPTEWSATLQKMVAKELLA